MLYNRDKCGALTSNTLTQLTHAASATINSLESEINVLGKGLKLTVSLGDIDAKYHDFKGLSLDSIPGNQLADDELAKKIKFPDVSKYTASLLGSYSFSVPGLKSGFFPHSVIERRF